MLKLASYMNSVVSFIFSVTTYSCLQNIQLILILHKWNAVDLQIQNQSLQKVSGCGAVGNFEDPDKTFLLYYFCE